MTINKQEILKVIKQHKYSDGETYTRRHDSGMTFTAYCRCGYGYTDLDNGLDEHLAQIIADKLFAESLK